MNEEVVMCAARQRHFSSQNCTDSHREGRRGSEVVDAFDGPVCQIDAEELACIDADRSVVRFFICH